MGEEYERVATILAEIGRLRPHYIDVVVEYCRACVRLRNLRAAFPTLQAEVYETATRDGLQLKTHPRVAQINET
jgi:hypothetical protein